MAFILLIPALANDTLVTLLWRNIHFNRSIKSLIHELFQQIEKQTQISLVDIEMIIKEQLAHCWGFRGMMGCEAKDLAYRVNV
jgi:hypothetical protein